MANQRLSLTPQITTGNVRTTLDTVAQNELGTKWTDPVNGVAYRYVQFISTASPAAQASPAACWWTDAAHTKVCATLSECYDGKSSSAAGLFMPNTTDISGLTIATLKNKYAWVCVGGVVTAVTSPAAAAGDAIIATQADWTTTGGMGKVTDGTAPTNRVLGYAKAASADAINVVLENVD